MNKVIVAVASTPKRVGLAIDPDTGNFTTPVTFFPTAAFKRLSIFNFAVYQLLQIILLFFKQSLFNSPFNFKRYAKCTHEACFRGNNHFLTGESGQSRWYRLVVTDAALDKNLLPNRPVALDPVAVVHAYRVNQAGNNILQCYIFMDRLLDV